MDSVQEEIRSLLQNERRKLGSSLQGIGIDIDLAAIPLLSWI